MGYLQRHLLSPTKIIFKILFVYPKNIISLRSDMVDQLDEVLAEAYPLLPFESVFISFSPYDHQVFKLEKALKYRITSKSNQLFGSTFMEQRSIPSAFYKTKALSLRLSDLGPNHHANAWH